MNRGPIKQFGDQDLRRQTELQELYTELADIESAIRLEQRRADHVRKQISEIETLISGSAESDS